MIQLSIVFIIAKIELLLLILCVYPQSDVWYSSEPLLLLTITKAIMSHFVDLGDVFLFLEEWAQQVVSKCLQKL